MVIKTKKFNIRILYFQEESNLYDITVFDSNMESNCIGKFQLMNNTLYILDNNEIYKKLIDLKNSSSFTRYNADGMLGIFGLKPFEIFNILEASLEAIKWKEYWR